jgi:hypothetical protein
MSLKGAAAAASCSRRELIFAKVSEIDGRRIRGNAFFIPPLPPPMGKIFPDALTLPLIMQSALISTSFRVVTKYTVNYGLFNNKTRLKNLP